MKRILKIISKIGVATMILTSFFYTLQTNSAGIAEIIVYVIGCICASYFVYMEE